ncbi:hypothetical protein AS156_23580 [Bradyrhizobium macuxiense]|uniref:Uncharacterized protein n=1 Tax=Bradyrhizobium macuxiense TaxID=1755647 RepID=A0A120FH85_9BRAD|nr:hypothetical protein [Bradyrhizobium macuxiense]KWV45559.1 hypothetical protein AS156_23580 [Bradyrhizobium macuxiense]
MTLAAPPAEHVCMTPTGVAFSAFASTPALLGAGRLLSMPARLADHDLHRGEEARTNDMMI